MKKHKEGNICCEGCYRLGIDKGKDDERKRVLKIIDIMLGLHATDEWNKGFDCALDNLKQKIQQGDKK